MTRPIVAVVILIAAGVCTWLISREDGEPSPAATPTNLTAGTTPNGRAAPSGHGDTVSPVSTDRYEELEGKPTAQPRDAKPVVVPDPGLIRLRVLDGRTGRDLEDVQLRAVTATRVLHAIVTSPFEMKVPGGEVSLLLSKDGYERQRLDATVTASDAAQDLGSVTLVRTHAVIDGRLELLARDTEVAAVELHGAGRNPMGPLACESDGHDLGKYPVCTRCGWGPTFSRARPEHDAFRFEQLAGGNYLLVARDPKGAVLATRRVAMKAQETKTVVIRVAFQDVTVTVDDAEGQPFDGLWNESGLWYSSKVRIFFWTDEICSSAAEIAPADAGYVVNEDATASSKPKTPERNKATSIDVDLGEEAAAKQRQREAAATAIRPSVSREPVERARKSGEDLWPRLPSPTPTLKTNPLEARRILPGTYEIRRVPVAAHRALASCGPIFTLPTSVDLNASGGRPIALVMQRKCGTRTRMLQAMARQSGGRISCTSCHALPANIFQ